MADFDKTWVQGWVDSDYRGKMLRFFPLSFADTVSFFDVWEGSPADILSKSGGKLKEYIAKSLKCKLEDLEETSSGFLLFAMESLLKAIDVEYLISGSRNLNIQMQTLLEKVGKASSQLSLENSQEKKDGELITS